MAITKPKISSLVANQLPEFIREDYSTFVAFLEAYYEYLETTKKDVYQIRDVDNTLDDFIKYFKNELASQFIDPNYGDQRFILSRIKDHYLAKGSEASYKFLFKILFNKNVTVDYPGKQVLRASDGKWMQDVSIFAKVNAGTPDDVVGRIVDVVTPTKIIRVLVDRHQDVELEINRYVEILPDVYEFYVDRRFFGDVSVNDKIRYEGLFDANILATTSKVSVLQAGKNFKAGQLFNIKNGKGNGSILKVKSVDSFGGILSAEFVKFGVGYETDFTSTLLANQNQTVTTAGGVSLNISTTSSAVTGFTISNGGSGYTSAPTITLSGGGFTSAATIGSVQISGGAITKINLSSSGSGYTSAPSISISGGGGTGASITSIIGKNYNYVINEVLSTFDEQGYINYSDYSRDEGIIWRPTTSYSAGNLVYINDRMYTVTTGGTTSSTPPTHTSGSLSNGSVILQYTRLYGPAFDGSYSGEISRQFFAQTTETTTDPETICIVKVELGPLTKYPGYYQNNDGFLDDAMFIQDSKYYQAFSYVLKIDEKLDSYKSAVKTLVHPTGMGLFGEYSIVNDFDISASLEFLMKIYSVFEQDEVSLAAQISTKHTAKYYDSDSFSTSEALIKDVVKGAFPETILTSNTGSINWTHIDSSSSATQNFTIPIIDVSNWSLYNDSVSYTDSTVINSTKNVTESISISEVNTTLTNKSIQETQAIVDFTTYSEYFGVGFESSEYFDSNYVIQTPTITITKF